MRYSLVLSSQQICPRQAAIFLNGKFLVIPTMAKLLSRNLTLNRGDRLWRYTFLEKIGNTVDFKLYLSYMFRIF